MRSAFSSIRIETANTHYCEPGWSWVSRPETFRHFNLWVVHGGIGQIMIGAERYDLSAGRVFCFRPYTACRAHHDPQRRLVVTAIHFHFLDAKGRPWHPPAAVLPRVAERVSGADFHRLTCDRITRLDALPGGRAEAEAYLTAMLVGLRGGRVDAVPIPATMAAAERHIRERPGEVESIASLAAQAGTSPEHFTRTFRKLFGRGPKEMLIDVRIERACDLLSHNQIAVGRIAELLGYRDVFFFSRQFKQRTGQSPTEWRDQAKA